MNRFGLLLALAIAAHAETLHYAINWPSGLNLGEATLHSELKGDKWEFDIDIDASVPGFAIRDKYKSSADAGFCSTMLEKNTAHGSKKSQESVQFLQDKQRIVRHTEPGGGKTESSVASCAKDALTFMQYLRGELAQGRVAPAQSVVLGAQYETKIDFAGSQRIAVDGKPIDADKAVVSIKGPSSSFTIELYFAKDAARTPVLARLPLTLSAFTVELIH